MGAGRHRRSVVWNKAGAVGLLCPQAATEYGGAGGTFKHNAVVIEELA